MLAPPPPPLPQPAAARNPLALQLLSPAWDHLLPGTALTGTHGALPAPRADPQAERGPQTATTRVWRAPSQAEARAQPEVCYLLPADTPLDAGQKYSVTTGLVPAPSTAAARSVRTAHADQGFKLPTGPAGACTEGPGMPACTRVAGAGHLHGRSAGAGDVSVQRDAAARAHATGLHRDAAQDLRVADTEADTISFQACRPGRTGAPGKVRTCGNVRSAMH